MLLTAYEVSKKYGFSVRHIRHLMQKGDLTGRLAKFTKARSAWLIDVDSVKRYKATKPRPGRRPAKKRK
jgi:hypothetical protein